MILYIDNQVCEVKFGLKSLIALHQISFSDSDEECCKQIYQLVTNPVLSFDKVKDKIDINNVLLMAFQEAFTLPPKINNLRQILDYLQNQKLDFDFFISCGVGELGLPPSEILMMTPKEFDLAYSGYLRKQELIVNELLLVLYQWQNKQDTWINLQQNAEYQIISREERQQILQELGFI